MVFLVCRVGWGILRLEKVVSSLVGPPGAADDWSSMVSGSRRVVDRVLADGDGRLEGGIGLFCCRYSSSWFSIRVGTLLVGGWLAGWCLFLPLLVPEAECRLAGLGFGWVLLPGPTSASLALFGCFAPLNK